MEFLANARNYGGGRSWRLHAAICLCLKAHLERSVKLNLLLTAIWSNLLCLVFADQIPAVPAPMSMGKEIIRGKKFSTANIPCEGNQKNQKI